MWRRSCAGCSSHVIPARWGLRLLTNWHACWTAWQIPRARYMVMEHAIACLQGGAGVGKTYTLKIVCDLYESFGGRVLLGALAGKAALRLARSTGGMPLHWHGSSANWLSASVSKAPCTIPGGMRLPWQDSRSG